MLPRSPNVLHLVLSFRPGGRRNAIVALAEGGAAPSAGAICAAWKNLAAILLRLTAFSIQCRSLAARLRDILELLAASACSVESSTSI